MGNTDWLWGLETPMWVHWTLRWFMFYTTRGWDFFFIMLQNSGNEKLCIISVIFHEMFLDCGWALVAETLDRKMTDEELLVHPWVRRRWEWALVTSVAFPSWKILPGSHWRIQTKLKMMTLRLLLFGVFCFGFFLWYLTAGSSLCLAYSILLLANSH